MFVTLHPQQCVFVRGQCTFFQHMRRDQELEMIILDKVQMENLNDIIINLSSLKEVKIIPLGKRMWLTLNYPIIELHDYMRGCKFRFFTWSWRRYI